MRNVSYTTPHEGDKMIVVIFILTAIFVLISITPLLITEDMHDIVSVD